MTAQRTPGAASVEYDGRLVIGGQVMPPIGPDTATPAELRANHEFLARAWNAHDDLLAALEMALVYWACRQQRYKNRHPVWVQRANAAIAKAKAGAL